MIDNRRRIGSCSKSMVGCSGHRSMRYNSGACIVIFNILFHNSHHHKSRKILRLRHTNSARPQLGGSLSKHPSSPSSSSIMPRQNGKPPPRNNIRPPPRNNGRPPPRNNGRTITNAIALQSQVKKHALQWSTWALLCYSRM